jgi:hypothetical protein
MHKNLVALSGNNKMDLEGIVLNCKYCDVYGGTRHVNDGF